MIGFIGGGNMADAIIKGIVHKYVGNIIVSEPRDERRAYLENRFNINTISYNKEVVKLCNIIILAVKPQNMDDVTAEARGPVELRLSKDFVDALALPVAA